MRKAPWRRPAWRPRPSKDIADAVGDNDLPAMFLLGNRYIEGMRKLAESSNAKMMVLPADIMVAVGGLINRKRG